MVPVSRCFSPQTRQEWLAVFRSPEFFRTYWLPRHFKEQVIVTRHFYLKPLLPFLTDDGHFFILALCHNHIRLLEGTHDSVSEVAVPEAVPQSQASAMKYDESDNELQYHSSSSGAVGGMGYLLSSDQDAPCPPASQIQR